MDHRKVGFDNDDATTILQAHRNSESIIFGFTEIGIKIPVDITFDGEKLPRRISVPIGGDGEAVHTRADISPQGPSTITLIGEIAAECVGYEDFYDVLTEDDAVAHQEADDLFGEWSGQYGGFLRAIVTIDLDNKPGNQISGTAEFAIVETEEEFDEYSHKPDGGIRAFTLVDKLVQND